MVEKIIIYSSFFFITQLRETPLNNSPPTQRTVRLSFVSLLLTTGLGLQTVSVRYKGFVAKSTISKSFLFDVVQIGIQIMQSK